jgi:hypothetical protein
MPDLRLTRLIHKRWHIRVGVTRSRPLITILLAAVVVGCTVRTAMPPTTTPSAMRMSTATSTLRPTRVMTAIEPSSTKMPGDVAGRLVLHQVASPPVIDGQVDAIWTVAEPLFLPLTWGMHGSERALGVELQGLRTDEAVYFLAQWLGEPPSGEKNTVSNKLTVHWRIPDAAARRLDCTVACHTANANGQGHFVYANAETIPQGGGEALLAAGGWHAGTWRLEWSRPLVSNNPFDLQFDDPKGLYLFFIKIFERIEGQADPVSPLHQLVFED